LPINAVQFTILSIIAVGYKPAVAPYGSELSSILLPIWKTATIDKTLFYETCNAAYCAGILDIIYFFLNTKCYDFQEIFDRGQRTCKN
jgi:hypothetical protein